MNAAQNDSSQDDLHNSNVGRPPNLPIYHLILVIWLAHEAWHLWR